MQKNLKESRFYFGLSEAEYSISNLVSDVFPKAHIFQNQRVIFSTQYFGSYIIWVANIIMSMYIFFYKLWDSLKEFM